jgi:large subunit ribosomal protein L10
MTSQAKIAEVEMLTKLIKASPTIAIAPITGLPASQFQEIRGKLRGQANIRVTKMTLLRKAIELAGNKKLVELEQATEGPIAVVFTSMNPFKLFAFLKRNKSKTFIKPGQRAPVDIIVPAGDTGIPPGPALGDLKNAGINVKIEGGSIKVSKDSTVAKKGEVVKLEVAGALAKLGVKPMEVGMTLSLAYEAGMIYADTVLNIDDEQVLASLQNGFRSALNLAFNTCYTNDETIGLLLQKGFREARNLGVNALVLDSGIIDTLLAKAQQSAVALKSMAK